MNHALLSKDDIICCGRVTTGETSGYMEWELNRRWEKRRQEVVFLRQHTKKGLPGFVDFPVGLVNSVHFLGKCLENGKYCRRQTFGGTSDEDFIFRLVHHGWSLPEEQA